jgi:membrane dipeptidase
VRGTGSFQAPFFDILSRYSEAPLISRRSFLEKGSLFAGLALTSRSLLAKENVLVNRSDAGWASAAQTGSSALLDQARALLKEAPLIDTHNDLPTMLLEAGGDLTKIDLGKVQPTLCADVPRLREGCVGVQYWSVWVASSTQNTHTSLHEAIREFDLALRLIRSQPDFEQARNADDIERIHKSGRISCLIGVEGGHMIEDSPAALRVFYELGARYMTLTHWDNIHWADAATDRPQNNGLTEFGKQIVREMNRVGMFVDISHVSADTMRDALSITRAPVIFSHSGSYAVNPHPRNAPDDVLAKLPANGGVIHVDFIRDFVAPRNSAWQEKRQAALREAHVRLATDKEIEQAMQGWEKANPYPTPTISNVADHIDHIREVAGIDHIGIGADYYDTGKNSMVEGLENVSRYPYLFAELLSRKYSREDVLKIAGRNHLRALRQMERTSAELQKTESPFIGKTEKVEN